MLSVNDIQWIKQNRTEILQGRTEVIDAKILVQGGFDPITREPGVTTVPATFEIVWHEVDPLRSGEIKELAGIAIQQGDAEVTFKAEDDPQPIKYLVRKGKRYKLIAINEKGLGELNRWTCLAREVI